MLRIIGNPDGTVAVDYTVNARMGWPYVTGPADLDEPVNNVLPGWDLTCGLTAAIGLLAAERHRSRTGEGQEVRLSLADVAYHITGSLGYIGDVEINGAERPRIGNDMYGTFGGDFATRDGRRVMLVVVTPRHVKALGQAAGLTETFAAIEAEHGVNLADEADRWEVREQLRAALEPWFASLSLEEVGARLTEAGVLWGPFRSHSQMVAEDPFCSTANPLFQRIDQPGIGPVLTPGSPLDFAASPRGEVASGPRLGQHTDEILAEVLGLSDDAIGALHDRGIVGAPSVTRGLTRPRPGPPRPPAARRLPTCARPSAEARSSNSSTVMRPSGQVPSLTAGARPLDSTRPPLAAMLVGSMSSSPVAPRRIR